MIDVPLKRRPESLAECALAVKNMEVAPNGKTTFARSNLHAVVSEGPSSREFLLLRGTYNYSQDQCSCIERMSFYMFTAQQFWQSSFNAAAGPEETNCRDPWVMEPHPDKTASHLQRSYSR